MSLIGRGFANINNKSIKKAIKIVIQAFKRGAK